MTSSYIIIVEWVSVKAIIVWCEQTLKDVKIFENENSNYLQEYYLLLDYYFKKKSNIYHVISPNTNLWSRDEMNAGTCMHFT